MWKWLLAIVGDFNWLAKKQAGKVYMDSSDNFVFISSTNLFLFFFLIFII